ncbi:MAG: bifunctional methylenetetrahydrofolate dehydrogenase/methenyltetrahydrofolate cyclohydrolase FolD [Bacilli bacterium]|nr:bifunctional methylenetetrahydrofolate dehydrogenase/methenyltetrahydrofolate cyclohydrolase FolD [Bacilli bacterium]
MELLNGKELAQEIRVDIKTEIKGCMIRPSLAVIQIGDDDASNVYIKNKEKACQEVGIYFRHFKYDDDTPELSIINKIKELNNDEYVNGIIVQLPIPEKYNEKRILNTIINSKDVDGLTDINTGRLVNGKKTLVPCTPLGIMTLLKKYEVELEGKNVVIIGRSKLVGRPLLSLMLNENATVTICHSKTADLAEYTKNADIIVVAAGVPKLLTGDMVKKGCVVVDVGINRVDDKLCGDVDFDSVSKKASYISPVPGGVGPMTIASLLSNVMTCYNNKK